MSPDKEFGNAFFKLNKPSADFPSLEDFLGVRTDPKKGRGIYNIGDKAIEPGTLLILDDAYSYAYTNTFDFRTDNCSACYGILTGRGIPCGGCVFNLYCSEACATSAHHNLHAKYECKLAPYLFEVIPKPVIGTMIHLALSVLLKLGPKALLDHYRQVSNDQGSQEQDVDDSSIASYLQIYNLIYHEGIRSEEELLEYTKYSVVLTEILDFCTDYFTCLNLDELEGKLVKEEFSRRLLLHQLSIQNNSIGIRYMDWPLPQVEPMTREEKILAEIEGGRGIYPAVSLINHSCAPNAACISLPGGVTAVVALEYVVPGQELFISYRSLYHDELKEERRKHLEIAFGFKCQCTACTGNWPLMEDLGSTYKKYRFICPDCRKKFESFHKIHLKMPSSSTPFFVCPRKCGFKIRPDDMEKTCTHFTDLYDGALASLDENNVVKAFTDAKKCVQHYDANFSKPGGEIYEVVSTMKQAIRILARRMFE